MIATSPEKAPTLILPARCSIQNRLQRVQCQNTLVASRSERGQTSEGCLAVPLQLVLNNPISNHEHISVRLRLKMVETVAKGKSERPSKEATVWVCTVIAYFHGTRSAPRIRVSFILRVTPCRFERCATCLYYTWHLWTSRWPVWYVLSLPCRWGKRSCFAQTWRKRSGSSRVRRGSRRTCQGIRASRAPISRPYAS